MMIFTKIRQLFTDVRGNVAIIFGIALLPVMLSVGVVIDYSEVTRLRTKVESATDAALLAAVSGVMAEIDLDEQSVVLKELRQNFEPFLLANMSKSASYEYRGHKISYDAESREVGADVYYQFKTFVMGIVGKDKISVKVSARSKIQMSSGGAVSMFLVLDKSGSMDWQNKMATLKTAVRDMSDQFEKIDPTHQFIRMGSVSYDSQAQKELPITWGTSSTNSYVQALQAFGGTNSSQAVKKAHQALRHPREITLHQEMSQQNPTKVMVFMTDGSNNRTNYDKQTIRTCTRAKNDDIEIYTVAFQAPFRGRRLLKSCASDFSHYFNATNSQDLIDAFRKIGASVAEKLVLSM